MKSVRVSDCLHNGQHRNDGLPGHLLRDRFHQP